MVDEVLDRAKRRAEKAEVFFTETENTEISFEAGKLKNAEMKTISGITLRVVRDGRIGFSSTTDMNRIDDMIDNALANSRFGKEARFDFPSGGVMPAVSTHDPAVEDFSLEEAVSEGRKGVELLGEGYPKGLAYVTLSRSVSSVRIANTSGLDVSYRSTGFGHSLVLNIVEGDSILWIEDGGEYGTLTLKTEEYVRNIVERARRAEVKAHGVSGEMPVVFTARQMPNILRSVELGVNGLSMLKGESPLIGKEGKKVLGTVTLTDDPLVDGAPGSRPFDDEGVPSRRTVLFDGGVFRSFLYDLDTAAAAGRESTASARRSMFSAPSIGSSNMVVSAGDSSLEEMVSGIDEGIIVYGVIGGGQSNLVAGDFALNVMLGFLVRKGEISGRLIDTMVSGNIYEAFGEEILMSGEITQTGSMFVPDVMFTRLSVSSAG